MKRTLFLVPLFVLAAALVWGCESPMEPMAEGRPEAASKAVKVDVCHFGWTNHPDDGLYYLISVKPSAWDGGTKSDHAHHHGELCWGPDGEIDPVDIETTCEDAGGEVIDPKDDFECDGVLDGATAAGFEFSYCGDNLGEPEFQRCASDDDGDGVWDPVDACQYTEKWAEVDDKGCSCDQVGSDLPPCDP